MDTEEAVERGTKFLQDKAGYYTHKLVSVKLEENVWVVRFDVGAFEEKIVELKIDDKTEKIVEYEQPK
jgi:hypothetical protein